MRFGKEPIKLDRVKILLCCLERRGNDATGIAVLNGEKVEVHKAKKGAWDFVTSREFEEWIAKRMENEEDIIGDVVLLHTRLATKGNPWVNANNHPLFKGDAAIVHNGMISNDDSMFAQLKLDRSAETDSDIIRAIIDQEGIEPDAVQVLNRLHGGIATAAVHPMYPGKVLLARSSNPLVTAWSDESEQLAWASEKEFLHKAFREIINRKGGIFQANKSNLAFHTMPNDTAHIWDREGGLVWHGKFQTGYGNYTRNPVYTVNEGYRERQKRWIQKSLPPATVEQKEPEIITNGLVTRVRCRNRDCNKLVRIPEVEQKNLDLTVLRCNKCKTPLAEAA